MNVIQERAQRILKCDKAYRTEEVTYLLSVMKGMDQEELIQHLRMLSLPEIKAVVSCGIPGHANLVGKQVLKDKKDALELFISEGGVEAMMGTEVETEGQPEEKDAEVKTDESNIL